MRRGDRAMLRALARTRAQKRDAWSDAEVEFANYWRQIVPYAPQPEHDVPIIPNRRFRADFVWREQRVVVEIEGGAWKQGRHTRGAGYESDCEKYNLLTTLGYRVLRFTPQMLRRDPYGCISLVRSLIQGDNDES